MRLVCTADWHGQFPKELPKGDVLIIAGDIMPLENHSRQYQAAWLRNHFLPMLEVYDYKHKIVTAGNHDFVLQDYPKLRRLFTGDNHLLIDRTVSINGINFHGSPWSNQFGNWAFMDDDYGLQEKWEKIPNDTHVLVVHGPPFGARDYATSFFEENAGSRSLRRRIVDIKPTLVVTGHIHEAYGMDLIGKTIVINASLRDADYNFVNPPIVIDVNEPNL